MITIKGMKANGADYEITGLRYKTTNSGKKILVKGKGESYKIYQIIDGTLMVSTRSSFRRMAVDAYITGK